MTKKLSKHYLWGGIAWYAVFTGLQLVNQIYFGEINPSEHDSLTNFIHVMIWIGPTLWMWSKSSKLDRGVE